MVFLFLGVPDKYSVDSKRVSTYKACQVMAHRRKALAGSVVAQAGCLQIQATKQLELDELWRLCRHSASYPMKIIFLGENYSEKGHRGIHEALRLLFFSMIDLDRCGSLSFLFDFGCVGQMGELRLPRHPVQ